MSAPLATPAAHLATFIKHHEKQGEKASRIMYSAFKELQLSDDVEEVHPEVLSFLEQLRIELASEVRA